MEHKLLIETISQPHTKLSLFKTKRVIQNRPFDYGVKVKNICSSPFDGCTIKNIYLKHTSKSHDYINECLKDFSIKSLNPNEAVDLWFDSVIFQIDGPIWLKFSLIPKNEEETIKIYKLDRITKESYYLGTNDWIDSIFIVNENSVHQKTTNILLVILTIIILLEQIFGIKQILLKFFSIFN